MVWNIFGVMDSFETQIKYPESGKYRYIYKKKDAQVQLWLMLWVRGMQCKNTEGHFFPFNFSTQERSGRGCPMLSGDAGKQSRGLQIKVPWKSFCPRLFVIGATKYFLLFEAT